MPWPLEEVVVVKPLINFLIGSFALVPYPSTQRTHLFKTSFYVEFQVSMSPEKFSKGTFTLKTIKLIAASTKKL